MRRLFLITGELSAQNYAEEIVGKLKGEFEIFTVSLKSIEGSKRVLDANEITAFGLFESLKKLPSVYRGFLKVKRFMEREKPDAVLLIDFPGFNLKVASLARRMGIKVLYFISPKFWAWGRGRARRIAGIVDRMYVIFPFEVDLYRRVGLDAVYVGNPVVDRVKAKVSREEFLSRFSLEEDKPIVCLLPGSRMSEIKYLLSPLLKTAKRLKAFQFILPVAESLPFGAVKGMAEGKAGNVRLIPGAFVYDAMLYSDAGVVASGTATLEAAVAGLPHVVVYRLNRFTYQVAKRVVRVKHISLPNIVAGKEVVRELIQDDVTPENVERELLMAYRSRNRLREVLKSEVKARLKPGAVENLCSRIKLDLA